MQLVCTLYRCPCKHNTEKSARMKNLFRTKFGKRVLIGGILLLAAALCGFAAVLSSFLPEPGMALQPTAASCCSSACMQSTRLSRTAARRSGTPAKRTITLPRPEAASRPIPMEPLNKSAAALSGSFAPTYRFENLEIHKVFLQFPNLNLEQNPSLTALAI